MSFQTINNLTYLSGTQEDYDNLLTKDDNTLYIITDTRRLYLGDIEYTNNQSFYGNILDIYLLLTNPRFCDIIFLTGDR